MENVSALIQVVIFILGSVLFLGVSLRLTNYLRPKAPNKDKLSTYECGEEAVGSAWGQFNVKFYLIALLFVLIEVEMAFIFPWAVVFGNKTLNLQTDGIWVIFSLIEVIIFTFVLVLGLVYAWKKGFLDWNVQQNKQTIGTKTDHKTEEALRIKSLPDSLYDTST